MSLNSTGSVSSGGSGGGMNGNGVLGAVAPAGPTSPSASSAANSVYSDFCQAWISRFPGSDLPAAWEEDVRANLKKHKSKVAVLREELEKEEMYVEYLDKLLGDIEAHRKQQHRPEAEKSDSSDVSALNSENRRRSAELKNDRPPMHLNLSGDDQPTTEFVTVINVPAAKNKPQPSQPHQSDLSSFKKTPPRPPPKRAASKDSLNSVSSPTTPSSAHHVLLLDELENPREGLLISPASQKEEVNAAEAEVDSSEEDFEFRGRPDGGEEIQQQQQQRRQLQQHPKVNKIKELMANWEENTSHTAAAAANGRPRSQQPPPPLQAKIDHPMRASSLKESSLERGRMGSPSGKSHDSSEDGENSPSRRRRVLPPSGETRLDRLVRRPSDRSSPNRHSEALPAPPLPKPMKKPLAKPRTTLPSTTAEEEPLYDTVANEEPEDEYDNHLLYGTNSTTKSGGSGASSSGATDLGFDEPKHPSLVLNKSGSETISSTETDRSLQRGLSLPEEEEEGNYVNIQYFLQSKQIAATAATASGSGKASNASSTNLLDTIQSDDELDKEDEGEELSSSAEALGSSDSSEADRILMYKSILNSMVDSEAAYLECLSVMLQYMKAMKVTLTTSQPVIPREEFDVIFYKIPDLHDLHFTFHESLKKQVVDRWSDENGGGVGHTFKMLASRTKIYAAFLSNYRQALDALHRCVDAYPQFADLARSIKLRSVKGQPAGQQGQSMSLEDLLHKPVARIQKQALGLQVSPSMFMSWYLLNLYPKR